MMMDDPSENSREDVELSFYISIFHLVSQSLLLVLCCVLPSEEKESFVASFGKNLYSYPFLFLTLVSSVLNIYISKRLSLRGPISVKLQLPVKNPNKTRSSSSTYLQRTVLRVKRLIQTLSPLKKLFKGIFYLLSLWILVNIAVFCLGADLRNIRTWIFSSLLTLYGCLPPILLGQDIHFFKNIFEDKSALYLNTVVQHSFGALFGAWIGAFPIPLDWDRDWQDWPIPCCIGASVGAYISCLYTTYNSYKLLKRGKRSSKEHKWKKYA
nr:uncharacterized protein LOC121131098 [Lepeophtheirus salmonis]